MATQLPITSTIYKKPSIVIDSSGDVWTQYVTYATTYRMLLYKNATEMENVTDDDIHGSGESLEWATMCIDDSDVIHLFCVAAPGGATRDVAYATYTISTSTLSSWVEIYSYKTAYTSEEISCCINGAGDLFLIWGYNPMDPMAYMITNESGSWVNYELGSDAMNRTYISCGIGLDGNDDVWLWYYSSTTPSTYYYRIWDSSTSTLGSESGSWLAELSPAPVYMCRPGEGIWDGTNIRYWYAPYATSSVEDIIKEQVDTTEPADISGHTVDRYYLYLSRSGSDFSINYIDGTWKYIGSYYGFEGISLWHEVAGTWEWQVDLRDVEIADYETHWIRTVTANTSPAANFGSDLHFCYRHYVDGTGWRMFIDVIYPGTPASAGNKAFTFGGGTPSDSQSAFIKGREKYSYQSAFLDGGYDEGPGGETRDAIHVSVPTKNPHIPAFIKGDLKFYFDVVNFNCPTGDGTDDIIGSLGGNQPSMAFFIGGGTTADNVMTANARSFFGFTDGFSELCWRAYQLDEAGGSSAPNGGYSTAACAGSSYGTGGSAGFDSWLTNGVRLDWTTGAGTAWDAAALLVACEGDGIQTAWGSINPEATAETGDKIPVLAMGFKPDIIITMTSQGGCGWGVGVAGYDSDDGLWKRGGCLKAWNTGPFNWPSSASVSQHATSFSIGDADVAGTSAVGRWAPNEPVNDNYWEFECIGNDGMFDHGTIQWFAFKLEVPGKALYQYQGFGSGPYDVNTGMNTEAVLGVSLCAGADINAPSHYGGFGASMFDGTHMFANNSSTKTGGSPWAAKCVGDTTKIGCSIEQKDGPTQRGTVSFDGWLPTGFQATGSSAPNAWTNNWYICFGNNYPVEGSTSAFMEGTAHWVNCHTWGQIHTKSSISAFFHVVDAQDYKAVYMQGLDPSRTSISAMTMGFDNPMIIPVEFTLNDASGTFDITHPALNGNQPKAAIFWLFGAPEHDASGINQDALLSIGFTDGVNQYCRAARAKTATTGFPQSLSWSPTNVMVIPNADNYSPGRIAEADWTSWIANGVRVTWNNAPGETYVGVCVLFVGSEIDVYTSRLDRPGTIPADQAIATVGFEPDIFFGFSIDAYEDEETELNWSDVGTVSLMYAINDERTYAPSQGYFAGCTAGDGAWDMGGEPEQHVHTWGWSWPCATSWGGDTTWLKSFDALGFTIRYDKSYAPGADYDIQYMCIKVGKNRKFSFTAIVPDKGMINVNTGSKFDMVEKPYGGDTPFNIIPEMLWFPSLGHASEYYEGQWENIYSTALSWQHSINFWGNSLGRSYQDELHELFWDHYSQHKDQAARSSTVSDPPMRINQMSYYDPHEYSTPLTASYKVIRNGIRVTIEYFDSTYDWDYPYRSWPYTPWTVPIFLYGMAEWTASMPAFCHGERADWPGRTPRGCYLEGAVSLQTSSTPAFMQVGPHGKVPVYLEGFEEGKSVKAAYLHGVDTDLDDQWAFLWGKVFILDDNDAYLVGQDLFSGSQECTLWGVDTDLDNQPAFSAGGWNVDGAISAYTRSGWDVLDDQAAYLAGTESTSKIFAYTEGFSATPTSNISAFTGGGGPWPFTDDFTGTDEDPWNVSKWISTEEM